MRIAVFVGEFPALSETFVLNQVTGLLDRGHDVHVYAERARPEPVRHDEADRVAEATRYELMPERRVPRIGGALRYALAGDGPAAARLRTLGPVGHGAYGRSLRLAYAARALAGRSDNDVILCHFAANGVKAALLRDAGALRGRLVTALHGADLLLHPELVGRRPFRRLVESGDLFLPISARWNDLLVEAGCAPEKIVVHRMGVDPRRFPRAAERVAGGPARVVSVGRLVEKKGVEDGLRAVARLRGDGVAVDYAIAGDGPLRPRLEAAARALGVAGAVRFLGAQTQAGVAELFADAHVLLAPSVTAADGDIEGIPVAIMEAMASGIPVVATRHSAIPELVEDGRSGFLVEERDPAALADRLRTLLEDEELRLRLGREARATVEREFDVRVLNDRLVDLFEGLIH